MGEQRHLNPCSQELLPFLCHQTPERLHGCPAWASQLLPSLSLGRQQIYRFGPPSKVARLEEGQQSSGHHFSFRICIYSLLCFQPFGTLLQGPFAFMLNRSCFLTWRKEGGSGSLQRYIPASPRCGTVVPPVHQTE